jgi:hypothetical protein
MNATNDPEVHARRASARRTAWVIGGIVIAIYAAFVLSGVIGR